MLFTLILIHGLIHFMGVAKAFGFAELPQLTHPVSRGMGTVWLFAGLVLLATAALLIGAPRVWWAAGLGAVLLSQAAVISSWSDAKFGTIANVVILAGVVYGFASQGPLSFAAEYRREVQERLAQPESPQVVTEADLTALPAPVQHYLRGAGAVGQPRVHHFEATWRGRIRATAHDRWMEFTAKQYNVVDERARFFLMDATRSGLSVDVYHVFRENAATMRVWLLSLVPLVNASGPELDRAETVTLFNDLCLLAPAALTDPAIRWEPIDADSARARYTVGSVTIGAVLSFNEAGELVNFVSDDRLVASADGTQFTRQRWSTPVTDYRQFGPRRVMTRGEGRWHPPEGEFVYLEMELLDLASTADSRVRVPNDDAV
jgi:hypothetical protein